MGSTAWLALVQSHRARAGQIRLLLTHQKRGTQGLTVHRSVTSGAAGDQQRKEEAIEKKAKDTKRVPVLDANCMPFLQKAPAYGAVQLVLTFGCCMKSLLSSMRIQCVAGLRDQLDKRPF